MGLEYRNCSSCTWTAAAETAKAWMEMATESQADHLNICLTVWENIMHSFHLHTQNHFRSMLPSWKHALLISSYAVQRQWLHLFQVQINMSEALVKQLNYSKINIQLPFSIQVHNWSQHDRKERSSMKIQPPTEGAALGSQGIPDGQSPKDIPGDRAPFLPALPTDKDPPLQHLNCHLLSIHMNLLKGFLKRDTWKELNEGLGRSSNWQ